MPYKPPKPELPPVRIVREGGSNWHFAVIFVLVTLVHVFVIACLILL